MGAWILLFAFPTQADIVQSEDVSASGGEPSSGSTYTLQSTLGQASIGNMGGADFSADVGFWDQREHLALCDAS